MKSRVWIIGLFAFLFVSLSMSFNYLGGDWEFVVYEGELIVSQETLTYHWVPIYSVYLTIFIALAVEFLSGLRSNSFLQNTKLHIILFISGYLLFISDLVIKVAQGMDFELFMSFYYIMISLYYILGSVSLILLIVNKFKSKYPLKITYLITMGIYIILNSVIYIIFIKNINLFINPIYIFNIIGGQLTFIFVSFSNRYDILSKLFYTINSLLYLRLYIMIIVGWFLTNKIYANLSD